MNDFFEKSISELQNERGIFHSEDDLKLALSLKIKKLYPEFEIRLEKPFDIKMFDGKRKESTVRAPIDIIVYDESGKSIPIELKYKTTKLQTESNGETYNLTKHGATNIGRYSFRKDIYRIEQYLQQEENSSFGFVFILTNEDNYINNDLSEKENLDKNFTCHQNSIIKKGDVRWNYLGQYDKHWTIIGNQKYILELKNNYPVKWQDYSKFGKSEFKFCLIKVER